MTVLDSLLETKPSAEAGTETLAGVPLNAVTLPVGGPPFFLAVSPNGRRVYVPVQEPVNTISVIDTTTNTVIRNPITFGRDPRFVAVAPNSNRVYVSNSGSGTVSVIDATTTAVLTTIPVGTSLGWLTVAPNRNRVYVTDEAANPGTVSVINTTTNTVVATIDVGAARSVWRWQARSTAVSGSLNRCRARIRHDIGQSSPPNRQAPAPSPQHA